MKRSWAWPVLMAIVLPGGVLLAAAWLLARARHASWASDHSASAGGSVPVASRWPRARGPRWPWPASASRRWEWPTGAGGHRPRAARPDTLH